MQMLIASILLLATVATAHADSQSDQNMTRFVSKWQASCTIPGHALQLLFESKCGDPTDDDMTVSIQLDDGPKAMLQLKPALFVAGKLNTKTESQCDTLSAVRLQSGNLLVLVGRDNRPSEDRLLALLVDGRNGNLLDALEDLGALSDHTELESGPFDVRVKLIRKWKGAGKNREVTPISGWMKIHEMKGKLVKTWDAALL